MDKYVKKVWLNKEDSASTGSIVVHDGPFQYKSDMKPQRDSWVEIKDCGNAVRLHKTYQDTEQEFVDKIELLKNVLDGFLSHLKKEL